MNSAIDPLQMGLMLPKFEQADSRLFEQEVLATISHELRTPLTVIQGFAQYLWRQEANVAPSERMECLAEIIEACDRQEKLIYRLLRLSHLTHVVDPLDLIPGEVSALVHRAIAIQQPLAPRHQLFLEPPAGPVPLARMHPEYVHEVLEHLLENAVKYSPQGGTVTVSVQCHVPDARQELPAALRGAPCAVEVLVSDEGYGIPAEHLESIFQPFHRVDMRLTREIGGLGIGLAFCRRAIEAQGGAIWAESVQGQGSTFHCLLPCA